MDNVKQFSMWQPNCVLYVVHTSENLPAHLVTSMAQVHEDNLLDYQKFFTEVFYAGCMNVLLLRFNTIEHLLSELDPALANKDWKMYPDIFAKDLTRADVHELITVALRTRPMRLNLTNPDSIIESERPEW